MAHDANNRPARAAITVNPAAGSGRASRRASALAQALRALGVEVDLLETRQADDLVRHAHAAAEKHCDLLVACGGDGTLGAVVNAVVGDRLDLVVAPAPAGTVNVVARALGYPLADGPEGAAALARLLIEAPRRRFDTAWLESAQATPRRFLFCAGMGPDAEIIADLHRHRHGPIRHWDYAEPLWNALVRPDRPRARILVDGVEMRSVAGAPEGAAFSVVANFALYAGHLRPCPEADPTDGWLDVLGDVGGGPAHWLELTWHLWRGTAGSAETSRRARTVEWRPVNPDGEPIPVQADGDEAGFLPARIQVEPGALLMPSPDPGPGMASLTDPL